MPRKSTRKAPSRRATAKKKATPKPTLDLLILECDTPYLAETWRDLVRDISQLIRALPTGTTVEVGKINSTEEMRDKFVHYAKQYSSINVVMIIGHANRDEIPLSQAHGDYQQWEGFASWFEYFKPKRMILAACEAGQLPSIDAFFDNLSTLKNLFASPFKLNRSQGEILKLLVPIVLFAPRIDPGSIGPLEVALFLAAGILHCTPRDDDWKFLIQDVASLT